MSGNLAKLESIGFEAFRGLDDSRYNQSDNQELVQQVCDNSLSTIES